MQALRSPPPSIQLRMYPEDSCACCTCACFESFVYYKTVTRMPSFSELECAFAKRGMAKLIAMTPS
eukprot:5001979-Amphidinium_carterae.1